MMRNLVSVTILVLFFSCLIVIPGEAGVLGVSSVYIEPTGFEDTSTHEWRGSFWVIAATTDTKESYLFFNESTSQMFGMNTVNGTTIVPTSNIKLTIMPKLPYWEIPLHEETYMIYPPTNGTDLHYADPWKAFSKNSKSIPELNITTLESSSTDVWKLYTPFDITVEKTGDNAFVQTIQVNRTETDTIVVSNPNDISEKLMIRNLGNLYTLLGQPSLEEILFINKTIAFKKNEVIKAIEYPSWSDNLTPNVDENFALYWFGGGDIYKAANSQVKCWFDVDESPTHVCWKSNYLGTWYNHMVEETDFAGSHRLPDDTFLGMTTWQHVEPVEASIFEDNPSTTPHGLSLVSYLKHNFSSSLLDLNDLFGQGWEVTKSNKLRVNAPLGSYSCLITILISSELADSVVYQPIVGCGKCEEAFWDSTKTAASKISNNDTATLKVRQLATSASKITVTPSTPSGVPVSVTPPADSAIVDPNGVHTFQFKVTNLGTQGNQTSTITFTISNDLGTVTDTKTLGYELIEHQESSADPQPSSNPQPDLEKGLEGDPMFMWLVAVVIIMAGGLGAYAVYSRRVARKKMQNQ